MKIVSWNCNGALRGKFEKLRSLSADIHVVQECENPAIAKNQEYRELAEHSLWHGCSKHKGIGIFSDSHRLKRVGWDSGALESFLPFTIDDRLTVLAVWTRYANSPTFGYIGQLWKYLQIHKKKFPNGRTIICGDLNSNVRWDKWDRWWNHSDVVKELSDMGIVSAYHHCYGEPQGKETRPTLFLQRNRQKPYHIDCFFAPQEHVVSASVTVGAPDDWLAISDHMPVVFEFRP